MKRIIVWFRRDLRLHDHAALWHACQHAEAVISLFVLDPAHFDNPEVGSGRVHFLLDCLLVFKSWELTALEQQGVRIGADYPVPIVDAEATRQRAINRVQPIRERLAAAGDLALFIARNCGDDGPCVQTPPPLMLLACDL